MGTEGKQSARSWVLTARRKRCCYILANNELDMVRQTQVYANNVFDDLPLRERERERERERFIQRSHVGHPYPLPFPSIPLFSPLTCKIINACMPFHLSPFTPYMLYQIRTSVPTSHLSLTTFNDSIINYAYSLQFNSHYFFSTFNITSVHSNLLHPSIMDTH